MGYRMYYSVVAPLLVFPLLLHAGPITFIDGGYDGVVVSIADNVPAHDCRNILDKLEMSVTEASQFLHQALGGRAYWRSVTVLLPDSWPSHCVARSVVGSSGERADISIGVPHPVFGNAPWTQQSRGCGQPGDMIHLSYRRLENIGRSLVQQWAKYRYGVFDEVGYKSDPVFPTCYQGDRGHNQVTGCSDLPIQDMGMCEKSGSWHNISELVHPDASSSIMFAAEAPQMNRFCDARTHNRYAPTKHNLICNRRSTLEVILQHEDFVNTVEDSSAVTNTTPVFHYKRRLLTRYVLVIEDTRDMLIRESWTFLRSAIRKWVGHDLPANTEVGVVLSNNTTGHRLLPLSPLSTHARSQVSGIIPFTPGDSHTEACLHCGIRQALDMLHERYRIRGPASSVIMVIAPGMDYSSTEMDQLLNEAVEDAVRIATINYPALLRPLSLEQLAQHTGGPYYTVQEQHYNVATSYISTYFKLANAMFNIAAHFYEGSLTGMPLEIHRRELSDDGRSSVTGSFVLDESVGEPAQFTVFTHNIENPLIRSISLVSPSQVVYSAQSDSLFAIRLLKLSANINETGTWTYTIERYPGNPQPHFVQVMATPRSSTAPVVRARAWTSSGFSPLVIYTEVKRGDYPVLGAKVEVTAKYPASNVSSILYKEKFELLDTGSGDPDITKGDGVYSRYFIMGRGGPGVYTFEVTVTDNGNTAYSWQETLSIPSSDSGVQCCGSVVPTPAVQPLAPFQRVLPPISYTIGYSYDDLLIRPVLGRIGDLRVEILAADLKARLTWTSPDMGGLSVARYELRYARTVADIVDRFETSMSWEYGTPFPLAPGSETSYTLDFTKNPSLLGTPLFYAIRGYTDNAQNSAGGPISNWVRVFVPSPPPPPPPPSTSPASMYETPTWPNEGDDEDSVVPRIAKDSDLGLELILPIVGGVALLAICIAVYCYVCVLRRRHGNSDKKASNKGKHSATGKQQVTSQNSTVTVVPSSPVSANNGSSNLSLSPSHTQDSNGLPQFDQCLDEKKRFSVAQLQQEEQMLQQQHEQMLQQQQQQHVTPHIVPNPNASGISTISNGTSTLVRGRTLSPYQSWTASQLLHEHERRQSPYGAVGEEVMGGGNQTHQPPPVPPLPSFTAQHNGMYTAGPIYGVHPGTFVNGGYHRNGSLVPFNPSLQGSLSSVSSGDRKKRNVTMV